MAEISEKLRKLSETEILLEFQRALQALYPSFLKLDILEDSSEPYDSFDRIAETLFEVLVGESIQWKYGLETPPDLPKYGFGYLSGKEDSFIEFESQGKKYRFIQFIRSPTTKRPFGLAEGFGHGDFVTVPVGEVASFGWVQCAAA